MCVLRERSTAGKNTQWKCVEGYDDDNTCVSNAEMGNEREKHKQSHMHEETNAHNFATVSDG